MMEAMDTSIEEYKLYVAVGKDLKESELTLQWALDNSRGMKICILHVHQPADRIPMGLGGKFPVSEMDDRLVSEYHEKQRQNMLQLLDYYCQIFRNSSVPVETQHIEMESIKRGIIELILQHGVKRLVMGAAAGRLYSKKMMKLKSEKAKYVCDHAPASCHIWFICKGNLIFTREAELNGLNAGIGSPALQLISPAETGLSSPFRSRSVTEGQNDRVGLMRTPAPNNRRAMSDYHGMTISTFSFPNVSGSSTPNRSNAERVPDVWNGIPRMSSCGSTSSGSGMISTTVTEGSEIELYYTATSFPEEITLTELYHQLIQAMAETENSKRDAFDKLYHHLLCKIEASEKAYDEELRRRTEVEEALAREKQEYDKIKQQFEEELRVALEHKLSLECQIAKSDQLVQELEQKFLSAVDLMKKYKKERDDLQVERDLMKKYKKERDDLQVERDDALGQVEELKEKQVYAASSSSTPQHFCEFSLSEIEEATRNFDPLLKIGEGGYGSVYKGVLHHTQVAIKRLHSGSRQGPSEFQQEVNVLSKYRHPNLVMLVGACPEAHILIYEYLSGGSLEDRLSCKDGTPPLTWQTRIRIAAELCSALSFLHSWGIVHGDLKPGNILLDDNLVSKLSDFGISRLLLQDKLLSNSTTLIRLTDPKGTPGYMDPEFFSTGELTSKSDVYSFGIILLRLLTGKSHFPLAKDVQRAVDKGNLNNILDPNAGDWPYVNVEQLARLALRCCDISRKNRPNLAADVWRVLEPMGVSCRFSSFRFSPEG